MPIEISIPIPPPTSADSAPALIIGRGSLVQPDTRISKQHIKLVPAPDLASVALTHVRHAPPALALTSSLTPLLIVIDQSIYLS